MSHFNDGLESVQKGPPSGGVVIIPVTVLPTINAVLNGTSALLLSLGYLLIRQRKITAHKLCMGSAIGTSTLFLVSYLAYHYQVGSIPFAGHGGIRALYFTILISHTVLPR